MYYTVVLLGVMCFCVTSLLKLVVDWLEKNALTNLERYPVKVNYFTDSVKWENTLHDIEHGIGKGYIITEMVRPRT